MDNMNITIKWGSHEIPVVMVRSTRPQLFISNSSIQHNRRRVYFSNDVGHLPISLSYHESRPVNESWQAIMTCFGQEHNAWGESAQDCIDGLRIMLESAAKEINELLEPEVL